MRLWGKRNKDKLKGQRPSSTYLNRPRYAPGRDPDVSIREYKARTGKFNAPRQENPDQLQYEQLNWQAQLVLFLITLGIGYWFYRKLTYNWTVPELWQDSSEIGMLIGMFVTVFILLYVISARGSGPLATLCRLPFALFGLLQRRGEVIQANYEPPVLNYDAELQDETHTKGKKGKKKGKGEPEPEPTPVPEKRGKFSFLSRLWPLGKKNIPDPEPEPEPKPIKKKSFIGRFRKG